MENIRQEVTKLNDYLFEYNQDKNYETYPFFLKFVETPHGDYIEFAGHCIWDSENDNREWLTDHRGEHREPIDQCLTREVLSIVKSMNSIQRVLE